jgi:hypothetical protein
LALTLADLIGVPVVGTLVAAISRSSALPVLNHRFTIHAGTGMASWSFPDRAVAVVDEALRDAGLASRSPSLPAP